MCGSGSVFAQSPRSYAEVVSGVQMKRDLFPKIAMVDPTGVGWIDALDIGKQAVTAVGTDIKAAKVPAPPVVAGSPARPVLQEERGVMGLERSESKRSDR